jgi:hypothetical protein
VGALRCTSNVKILTTRVVHGEIDVPAGTLREGETVTVVVHDRERSFELSEAERTFLADSLAQVERGEWVDGWKLLDELSV